MDTVLETILAVGTTAVLWVSISLLGNDASRLAVKQKKVAPPTGKELSMDHQSAAIQQDAWFGMGRMTVGMLEIKHRSKVCVSILFWSY